MDEDSKRARGVRRAGATSVVLTRAVRAAARGSGCAACREDSASGASRARVQRSKITLEPVFTPTAAALIKEEEYA